MLGAVIAASCIILLWVDSILTRRGKYQRQIEELKEKLKEAQKQDSYTPSSWNIDSVKQHRINELTTENTALRKLLNKRIDEF